MSADSVLSRSTSELLSDLRSGELTSRRLVESCLQQIGQKNPTLNAFVSVDASWSNRPNASLGLLVDDGTCNPDGLVFLIGPHGYYSIIQAVRDEDGEWRHWRPFMDWVKSSLIRSGQDSVNEISAEYEFTDELRVSFYINGTYVTRVRVFGYNGSDECKPGLYADGGLEANFDNFDISDR